MSVPALRGGSRPGAGPGVLRGGLLRPGLGLANGDLFTHVIAYAPGSLPQVLREEGYEVEYVEYDGGHRPPDRVFVRSAEWFLEVSP